MNDVPHLALPITVSGTSFETVQQDTEDELAVTVAVLLRFERGSRIEQPDFGLTNPAFGQMPIDVSEIEQQAGVWEPRAAVSVQLHSDPAGEQRVVVGVTAAALPEIL